MNYLRKEDFLLAVRNDDLILVKNFIQINEKILFLGNLNGCSKYKAVYIPLDLTNIVAERTNAWDPPVLPTPLQSTILTAAVRESYKVLEYLLTLEEMVKSSEELQLVYERLLQNKQYNLALTTAKLLGVLHVSEFLNYYIKNSPIQDPYFIQKIKQAYDFTKFNFYFDLTTNLPAVETALVLQDLNANPEKCLHTNFVPFKFNAQGISIYGYLKLNSKLYPNLLNFIEKNISYFTPEIIFLDQWLGLLKNNKIEDLLKFAQQGKFCVLSDTDKNNFLFELIERFCLFQTISKLEDKYLNLIEVFINLPGVRVNYKDNMGGTLLHQAARFSNKEIFNILLYNGGDLNLENNAGQRPIDIAKNCNNKEIVNLINNLNNPAPMYFSSMDEKCEKVHRFRSRSV